MTQGLRCTLWSSNTGMHTILDTKTIDPGFRFSAFQKAVCQIASLGASRARESTFNARIQRSKVGSCECSLVEYETATIERRLEDIASEKSHDYLLALHVDGNVRMRHLDREIQLQRGAFVIVDSALPYRIEAEGSTRRFVMRYPRSEFMRRGLSTHAVCGRLYNGERGTGGIASRLMRVLTSESVDLVSEAGHSLAASVLDLIAEAESEDGPLTQIGLSHDHIVRRIRTIVLTHLFDPDLSVAGVAALSGISVRYLHQVFGATGTTLHKWIESERLERAWRALRSQHQRERSIQEIALDCGFSDPAHFSRRFTKKFGMPPRQVRAASEGH